MQKQRQRGRRSCPCLFFFGAETNTTSPAPVSGMAEADPERIGHHNIFKNSGITVSKKTRHHSIYYESGTAIS